MLKFAVHFLGKITPDVAAKAVTDYARHVASVGNTMLHEPGTHPLGLDRAIRQALEHACLPHQRERDVRRHERPDARSSAAASGKARPSTTPCSRSTASRSSATARTRPRPGRRRKPYLKSTSKGSPNFDAAQMKDMVAEVKALGLPVQIHCNGDYTADIALDAIEAAYAGSTELWRQPHRARDDGAARPDPAHENAQRAAELPHEPCALLRRGLSRPDLRTGTRRLRWTPQGPA